ncbi:MAG TPA: hypothetical protein VMT17_11620 [Anaeromyxobacteraceae bacterium]|nr:hypothetical protein [Anaeromyxobacteraceae bacterium]
MKPMTLEEAAKAIRAMPREERHRALQALADAAGDGLASGPSAGWTILDPLQCTPDMAAHCDYRGGPGSGRICLVAVDGLDCPHAEYVP